MLSIRMQRLGRKGHPVYRVVVQDSRQSPDSGKYVAMLGSYDPHTKTNSLNKEKAEFYIKHGAQPSDRVVTLLKSEKIKLPAWVKQSAKQARKIRNPEKLRKNRPADATPEETAPAAETEDEAPKPAEAEVSQEQPKQEETDKQPETTEAETSPPSEEEPAPKPEEKQDKPEAEKPDENSEEKA